MDVFLSNVLDSVNKNLLKCPIRKGSYLAVDSLGKDFNNRIVLPPFMKSGQEVNFFIIFKSVIKRKAQSICSVELDLIVTWFLKTICDLRVTNKFF